MRGRSRAGSFKPRRRKPAEPKRASGTAAARPRSSSAASQESEIAQLRRELDEAREQQAATANVLKSISRSTFDLKAVLDTLAESAATVCETLNATIYLRDEDFAIIGTHFGPLGGMPVGTRRALNINWLSGHAVLEARTIHVADLSKSDEYPEGKEIAQRFGQRATLTVPLLRDQKAIGGICVRRREARPFTDKQIAQVQNFAAQAVIAIENARLLNELRQSLEQQTATADVLRIISSSPGELEPVFQAMLANATRICEAKFGILYRCEGDALRTVAMHDAPQPFAEVRRSNPIIRPNPYTTLGRAMTTKQPLQIANILEELDPLDDRAAQLPKLADARTVLAVPMLKENELVGAFLIYRTEVRPFTEKQIALVQSFAAQAVIAIENTRLLNELRETTEEVIKLNQQLEHRVVDQVGEIERMSKLRRFLPPQVADLIVASGTEKQLESHRREITALFCDLRGFTGFSESSDPEDVMALLRDYHAAIGQIIIKYSGTLERFAGDGVMVIFNDPVPVENPALQAVLMALDMRTAIGGMIEKWRDLGHDLGFGIGIEHGFATLGTIGFEGRFDYAAIGTVSNVASRLCDEAKPGQILISPRVRQAVEKAVTIEPVGEFTLKGIRRPMMTYNVLEPLSSKPN